MSEKTRTVHQEHRGLLDKLPDQPGMPTYGQKEESKLGHEKHRASREITAELKVARQTTGRIYGELLKLIKRMGSNALKKPISPFNMKKYVILPFRNRIGLLTQNELHLQLIESALASNKIEENPKTIPGFMRILKLEAQYHELIQRKLMENIAKLAEFDKEMSNLRGSIKTHTKKAMLLRSKKDSDANVHELTYGVIPKLKVRMNTLRASIVTCFKNDFGVILDIQQWSKSPISKRTVKKDIRSNGRLGKRKQLLLHTKKI